jgi:hypothetical protein
MFSNSTNQQPAICDVCNAAIATKQGAAITANAFKTLLSQGFGIDPTNIEMLTGGGVNREQAIALLKQHYEVMQSDWLLCPVCFNQARLLSTQTAR